VAIFRVRQSDRRVAAADSLQFPGGVRHRFAQLHGDLTSEGLRSVEAAARQWFRLAARHPRARLAMPSVLVDDLWREFRVHSREYEEFCAAAFGRVLQPTAESRPRDLRDTFRFAQQDEPDATGLPLLFRVDQRLAGPGGRSYLADCGGRGVCYGLKDTTCLQHLDGPGKAPGGGGRRDPHIAGQHGAWSGGGDGGGCGGGCGGGE
jgi:hypothetical protein